MPIIKTNNIPSLVGELVWIPSFTPLMYYQTEIQDEWSIRSTLKKEPAYGLVISVDDNILKVLVGSEQYYVRKKEVYGVENDH